MRYGWPSCSEGADILEAHIDKYKAVNIRRSMLKSERVSAGIFYDSVHLLVALLQNMKEGTKTYIGSANIR